MTDKIKTKIDNILSDIESDLDNDLISKIGSFAFLKKCDEKKVKEFLKNMRITITIGIRDDSVGVSDE